MIDTISFHLEPERYDLIVEDGGSSLENFERCVRLRDFSVEVVESLISISDSWQHSVTN